MDNSDITMSIPEITNSYVKVKNNLPLPSGRSSSTLPYNKNSSINKLIADFSNRTDSEEELKVPKIDKNISIMHKTKIQNAKQPNKIKSIKKHTTQDWFITHHPLY